MENIKHAFDIVAAYFGVLSEPTRLQIMHATCEEEKTVSQIVAELGATQSNVSRHLTLMHRGGLLTRRKEGSQVYYVSADPEMVENLRNVCIRIATRMDPRTPMRAEFLRRLHEQKRKRKKRAALILRISSMDYPPD